ncbi:Asp-tRNA(Asn)/Glu-tRNA(Gln) amidotransferase subunit GatA [Candidatus Saccharibacteria bacterium]|nr:Asp-tRNA(Asn)/Glu-tRNA(Gln) amidotransferase subunit GatA [Candidatus Saccharibacteria bacterium]
MMKIANKKVSAERLVRDALEKAKHFSDYNIFTFLNEEGALKKAREIDKKIKRGEEVGRLAGVPYALKDNFLSPEGESTASAHILEGFTSPITATAVKKLEDEGAIMIGRTNMDAFAHGSSTENSYFGPTLNAFDKERVAGGSSGGSAVAVALDIVEFATGTDTGGSIRQPASFNGVYGLKPTYGCISRYGVVAMASSTDCVGFFTKTPEDMDLLMSITSGRDPKDMTTLPDYYNADTNTESSDFCARVGVIKDFDNTSVNAEIRDALKSKIEFLKSRGHEIVELDMPSLKYALSVYYIIVPAEVASNLSRYDGVRYGLRSKDSSNLDKLYENTRSEGFMPENKRRIMIGNFVLSSGFYDAYFLKAAKARTLIVEEYAKAFSDCDFILSPVSPSPAFKLGEKVNDPVAMYLEDVMSVSLNLAGVPGLTIPVGKTKDGLPIGLQIVGPRRSDKRLIEFSKELRDE